MLTSLMVFLSARGTELASRDLRSRGQLSFEKSRPDMLKLSISGHDPTGHPTARQLV
jgi:hypothetical protein